ncbi:PhzF family phenazine biosynthesis protein [Lacimicrobium alkaliphilum]|uniref:Phenazine biosynthesis protein n=1 Tax=Lacimicrobium alkaliphilum TaxID=1526571 RepID=A0A0U3ACF3_9ALTE|nr:PhzF family phenazine biosynthesis protein [Lacimicrobium alkaliphilum]ALS98718.1 phenazine biosynthesis protein [Lacimicrobium alkaliphilum]
MKVKVAIVDAFVDGDKGGNPAGVVLDADQLSGKQKLEIASKVGLSETAFVSKSDSADFKLDFYTPQKQIAHCGHATIATFSLLSQQGLVPNKNTSKETIDGNRDIEVMGDFAYMGQTAPEYNAPVLDHSEVYAAAGVSDSRVLCAPAIVNTGNSFLIIGVKTLSDLASLTPDYQKIEAISEEYDLIGFYVFTPETNKSGRDASTRMFAPRYGIQEESATGMAAGPLACYLYQFMGMHQQIFLIEQGYSMQPPSPSCIEVVLEREGEKITGLKAGGTGKPSRYEEIEI